MLSGTHRCLVVGSVLALALVIAGCSQSDPTEAPYEGHRPLEILRVTQNLTPDIQWVGGRVAAIGINRGYTAALDTSLVWIRTASDNSIGSVQTVGADFDEDFVLSVGGTPQSEMGDREVYTFWLATRDVFDAGLDVSAGRPGDFAAVTDTMMIFVNGVSRSGMGVTFQMRRDERIISDHYVVTWTPEDVAFRRMVINNGTTPSWAGPIWHILTPEDDPPAITSPIRVGVAPTGADEVTAFPDDGFPLPQCPAFLRRHILWAVTDDWNGSFIAAGPNAAPGYAQFEIRFPNLDCPDPE